MGGLSPEKQAEIALAKQREKEFTDRLQEVEIQRELSEAQAKGWVARVQREEELERQGIIPSKRYGGVSRL